MLELQAPSAQQPTIAGLAKIVDGDTFAVGPVTIRVNGIDAAELGQRCRNATGGTWPCDEAAAERLKQLVGAADIRCDPLDRDAYSRIIARCFAGEIDVAKTLASEGLATGPFVRYSTEYVRDEEAARSLGIGVCRAGRKLPGIIEPTAGGVCAPNLGR